MQCSRATPSRRPQSNCNTWSLMIKPRSSQDRRTGSTGSLKHEETRLRSTNPYVAQPAVLMHKISNTSDRGKVILGRWILGETVKQWSAVRTANGISVYSNWALLCSPCWRNFLRAKINTPLLLPNTSVLVIPQTLVHEDRGTCHITMAIYCQNTIVNPTVKPKNVNVSMAERMVVLSP